MTSIDYGTNAKCLGYDLLFILLWVGVWNSTDLIVNRYLPVKKKQLLLYLSLVAIMIVVLVFVNRGCSGTVQT